MGTMRSQVKMASFWRDQGAFEGMATWQSLGEDGTLTHNALVSWLDKMGAELPPTSPNLSTSGKVARWQRGRQVGSTANRSTLNKQ